MIEDLESPPAKLKFVSELPRRIPRNRTLLLFVTLCVTITFPTAFGYDSMMMSNLNALPYYKDYFHINVATSNLNTASMWIGEVLAVIATQFLTDKWGRRHSIFVAICIIFVGIILQSAAHNTGTFVVGRVFLGFGFALGEVSVPTLISELCPRKFRGMVLGSFFSCFLLGAIIAASVTYGTKDIESTWCWRIPSIIQGVPTFISAIFVFWAPESPRYLLSNGKEQEAREILAIVEGSSAYSETINEMVVKIKEEKIEKSPKLWFEIFKGKNNHRRLVTGFLQAVMTEMGGSSVCSYYQSFLLEQAGIIETNQKLQVSIVSSCWCLVWALAGSYSFDITGRKTNAVIGTAGMALAFIIMGGLIKVHNDDPSSISPYGPVSMIFVFQLFYSISWTPLNYCYSPEVWPNRLRVVGVSWFTFWSSAFGLLANFTLSIAMSNMSYKFYFLNAGYDILFGILIAVIWVETKDISLEDIEDLYDQTPYCSFGNSFYVPTVHFQEDDVQVIDVVSSMKQ